MVNPSSDAVAAVTDQGATGRTAEIFADIRQPLDVEALIWQLLATMPGGLEWAWTSLKPLYHDVAIAPAAHILSHARLRPRPDYFAEHGACDRS